MKAQNLLSRTFTRTNIASALFAAALLLGSSATFAQVKIGTNPTTIEPASNLEVEASTAGRKMKVDKVTGQVTIADGTQGFGKILTSDPLGGASWQPAPGTVLITGGFTPPNFTFITPPPLPSTGSYIANAPITLNKGTYTLYYYAQFDYYVPGSTTTGQTPDPTSAATLSATWPNFIYFDFITESGAATFPSWGATASGPHVLPAVSSFQVGATLSQIAVVTADNTVIKPRYWSIRRYGRISNIGPIIAVKM